MIDEQSSIVAYYSQPTSFNGLNEIYLNETKSLNNSFKFEDCTSSYSIKRTEESITSLGTQTKSFASLHSLSSPSLTPSRASSLKRSILLEKYEVDSITIPTNTTTTQTSSEKRQQYAELASSECFSDLKTLNDSVETFVTKLDVILKKPTTLEGTSTGKKDEENFKSEPMKSSINQHEHESVTGTCRHSSSIDDKRKKKMVEKKKLKKEHSKRSSHDNSLHTNKCNIGNKKRKQMKNVSEDEITSNSINSFTMSINRNNFRNSSSISTSEQRKKLNRKTFINKSIQFPSFQTEDIPADSCANEKNSDKRKFSMNIDKTDISKKKEMEQMLKDIVFNNLKELENDLADIAIDDYRQLSAFVFNKTNKQTINSSCKKEMFQISDKQMISTNTKSNFSNDVMNQKVNKYEENKSDFIVGNSITSPTDYNCRYTNDVCANGIPKYIHRFSNNGPKSTSIPPSSPINHQYLFLKQNQQQQLTNYSKSRECPVNFYLSPVSHLDLNAMSPVHLPYRVTRTTIREIPIIYQTTNPIPSIQDGDIHMRYTNNIIPISTSRSLVTQIEPYQDYSQHSKNLARNEVTQTEKMKNNFGKEIYENYVKLKSKSKMEKVERREEEHEHENMKNEEQENSRISIDLKKSLGRIESFLQKLSSRKSSKSHKKSLPSSLTVSTFDDHYSQSLSLATSNEPSKHKKKNRWSKKNRGSFSNHSSLYSFQQYSFEDNVEPSNPTYVNGSKNNKKKSRRFSSVSFRKKNKLKQQHSDVADTTIYSEIENDHTSDKISETKPLYDISSKLSSLHPSTSKSQTKESDVISSGTTTRSNRISTHLNDCLSICDELEEKSQKLLLKEKSLVKSTSSKKTNSSRAKSKLSKTTSIDASQSFENKTSKRSTSTQQSEQIQLEKLNVKNLQKKSFEHEKEILSELSNLSVVTDVCDSPINDGSTCVESENETLASISRTIEQDVIRAEKELNKKYLKEEKLKKLKKQMSIHQMECEGKKKLTKAERLLALKSSPISIHRSTESGLTTISNLTSPSLSDNENDEEEIRRKKKEKIKNCSSPNVTKIEPEEEKVQKSSPIGSSSTSALSKQHTLNVVQDFLETRKLSFLRQDDELSRRSNKSIDATVDLMNSATQYSTPYQSVRPSISKSKKSSLDNSISSILLSSEPESVSLHEISMQTENRKPLRKFRSSTPKKQNHCENSDDKKLFEIEKNEILQNLESENGKIQNVNDVSKLENSKNLYQHYHDEENIEDSIECELNKNIGLLEIDNKTKWKVNDQKRKKEIQHNHLDEERIMTTKEIDRSIAGEQPSENFNKIEQYSNEKDSDSVSFGQRESFNKLTKIHDRHEKSSYPNIEDYDNVFRSKSKVVEIPSRNDRGVKKMPTHPPIRVNSQLSIMKRRSNDTNSNHGNRSQSSDARRKEFVRNHCGTSGYSETSNTSTFNLEELEDLRKKYLNEYDYSPSEEYVNDKFIPTTNYDDENARLDYLIDKKLNEYNMLKKHHHLFSSENTINDDWQRSSMLIDNSPNEDYDNWKYSNDKLPLSSPYIPDDLTNPSYPNLVDMICDRYNDVNSPYRKYSYECISKNTKPRYTAFDRFNLDTNYYYYELDGSLNRWGYLDENIRKWYDQRRNIHESSPSLLSFSSKPSIIDELKEYDTNYWNSVRYGRPSYLLYKYASLPSLGKTNDSNYINYENNSKDEIVNRLGNEKLYDQLKEVYRQRFDSYPEVTLSTNSSIINIPKLFNESSKRYQDRHKQKKDFATMTSLISYDNEDIDEDFKKRMKSLSVEFDKDFLQQINNDRLISWKHQILSEEEKQWLRKNKEKITDKLILPEYRGNSQLRKILKSEKNFKKFLQMFAENFLEKERRKFERGLEHTTTSKKLGRAMERLKASKFNIANVSDVIREEKLKKPLPSGFNSGHYMTATKMAPVHSFYHLLKPELQKYLNQKDNSATYVQNSSNQQPSSVEDEGNKLNCDCISILDCNDPWRTFYYPQHSINPLNQGDEIMEEKNNTMKCPSSSSIDSSTKNKNDEPSRTYLSLALTAMKKSLYYQPSVKAEDVQESSVFSKTAFMNRNIAEKLPPGRTDEEHVSNKTSLMIDVLKRRRQHYKDVYKKTLQKFDMDQKKIRRNVSRLNSITIGRKMSMFSNMNERSSIRSDIYDEDVDEATRAIEIIKRMNVQQSPTNTKKKKQKNDKYLSVMTTVLPS
ncbi:hypothetical protein SNEBB_011294 [Seison nebaliae]|nr:hypothetical protein SNEBB_011294 [Seison nebaliae]